MGIKELWAKTAGGLRNASAKIKGKRGEKSPADLSAHEINASHNIATDTELKAEIVIEADAEIIADVTTNANADNIIDTNYDISRDVNYSTAETNKKARKYIDNSMAETNKKTLKTAHAESFCETPTIELDLKDVRIIPKKSYVTLAEKIRRKIYITRIVFSVLSMIIYTVFTLIMLQKSWGNTTLNTVILCFIGLYILLFTAMIIITQRASKSGKKLTRSFKDYKSGLKIMNSVLRLINFVLTLSLFFTAAASRRASTPFQTTVMVVSAMWAFFQIIYQVSRIRKRHKKERAAR